MQHKKITVKSPAGETYTVSVSCSYTGASSFTPNIASFFGGNGWTVYDDWNDWINIIDIPANKDAEPTKDRPCLHEWKEYTGFTEQYWYCEKCDAKSEENPNKCF